MQVYTFGSNRYHFQGGRYIPSTRVASRVTPVPFLGTGVFCVLLEKNVF